MRYAWIENGVVTNTIVLNDRNAGDFPKAVKLGDRPVAIGDSYANGRFYRDGAEVLTPAEENAALRAALETLGVETEESSNEN
jgi:hypothetical protein